MGPRVLINGIWYKSVFIAHSQDRVPKGTSQLISSVRIDRRADLETLQFLKRPDSKAWDSIFRDDVDAFFFVGYGASRRTEERSNVDQAARRRKGSVRARRVWRDLLTEGMSCGLYRIERLMRLQANSDSNGGGSFCGSVSAFGRPQISHGKIGEFERRRGGKQHDFSSFRAYSGADYSLSELISALIIRGLLLDLVRNCTGT
jgi:hypothetical protein